MEIFSDAQKQLHDLRTCLNHIVGYCDILLSSARDLNRLDLIAGIERQAKTADRLKNLFTVLQSGVGAGSIAPELDLGQSLIDALNQLIAGTRHQLDIYRTQAPMFVDDMEEILSATLRMESILETTGLEQLFSVSKTSDSSQAVPHHINARIPARVLIIDDDVANQNLISRQLTTLGHTAFSAGSGEEALAFLGKRLVDIIILDILMPGLTGFSLLKILKAEPRLQGIPVIIISATYEATNIAQSLNLGAEDFLPKDFDPVILRARLDASLEKQRLQRQQTIYIQALVESQRKLNQELADAAQYIVGLIPKNIDRPLKAAVKLIPSMQLGGDICGFHLLDDDHLALYLLDVSGHGIKSALLAVSIANIIKNQGLADTSFFDPALTLGTLNRTFSSRKLPTMIFSLWYGVYQISQRTLRYASGGSPPACLIRTADPGKIERLSVGDPVLGATDSYPFQNHQISLNSGDRLFLYSDGVYEVQYPDGKLFGLQAFQALLPHLQGTPEDSLGKLTRTILDMTQTHHFSDDVSLLSAEF